MKSLKIYARVIDVISLRKLLKHYDKRIYDVRAEKEKHIDNMSSKLPEDWTKMAAQGLSIYDELKEAGDPDYVAATKLRTAEQRLLIGRYWVLIARQLYVWLLVVVVAYGASKLLPKLGSNVNKDYYVALSQIFPILLIALYLGSNGKYTESDRRNLAVHLGTISGKFAGIAGILLGTCVCLIVLANSRSSSFFFLLTLVTIIFTIYTFFGGLKRD